MKDIYLVKYCGGRYDTSYEVNLFVTADEYTAKNYVSKFNTILEKWKNYYKQYESEEKGFTWIADEHADNHFYRWSTLEDIDKCYYIKIEQR